MIKRRIERIFVNFQRTIVKNEKKCNSNVLFHKFQRITYIERANKQCLVKQKNLNI